jgi:hypothetical protein
MQEIGLSVGSRGKKIDIVLRKNHGEASGQYCFQFSWWGGREFDFNRFKTSHPLQTIVNISIHELE